MPMFESTADTLWLWAAIGYLLGSIPFGIVLAQVMGLGDLRKIGSGNIGATNVLRTGNKLAAALTLVFDAGKGAAAVLLARYLAAEDAAQVAALAAFIGHLFPVWLMFRGGKGVATFLGLFLALAWPVGIALCATWLVAAYATRYSSMAALITVATLPFWILGLGYGTTFVLGFLLTVLVYLKHLGNIKRLRAGTESKINLKRSD
jgi:glycerol-3-phosphate acyltransferase PlsY